MKNRRDNRRQHEATDEARPPQIPDAFDGSDVGLVVTADGEPDAIIGVLVGAHDNGDIASAGPTDERSLMEHDGMLYIGAELAGDNSPDTAGEGFVDISDPEYPATGFVDISDPENPATGFVDVSDPENPATDLLDQVEFGAHPTPPASPGASNTLVVDNAGTVGLNVDDNRLGRGETLDPTDVVPTSFDASSPKLLEAWNDESPIWDDLGPGAAVAGSEWRPKFDDPIDAMVFDDTDGCEHVQVRDVDDADGALTAVDDLCD